MSIRAMSIVWSAPIADRSMKLCALALADWCNDEGESLHPSIRKIAERMSASPRTAQRTLRDLEDHGWLEVVGNPFGGKPGASREYRLRLDRLEKLVVTGDTGDTPDVDSDVDTGDMHDTGDTGDTGDKRVTRRVTRVTQTGDTGDTLSVIEPSIEPSGKKERTRARRTCPEGFEVTADLRAWADREVPGLDVNFHTGAFRDHEFRTAHTDWLKAWRNWMRRAWTDTRSRPARSPPRDPPANPARDRRMAMSGAIGSVSTANHRGGCDADVIDVEPRRIA